MVRDKSKLGISILKLLKSGKWDKKYVIVTDIVKAEETTIAIATSNDSSISFNGQCPIIKEYNLSDVGLDLKIEIEKEIGLSISSEGQLTPLIGLSGFKPKLFSFIEFKKRPIKKRPIKKRALIRDDNMVYLSFLEATKKASVLAISSPITLDAIGSSLQQLKMNFENTSNSELKMDRNMEDRIEVESIGRLKMDDSNFRRIISPDLNKIEFENLNLGDVEIIKIEELNNENIVEEYEFVQLI
jgi:hypothetical protein